MFATMGALAAGCAMAPLPLARTKPAAKSLGEGTYRIECHYEMNNCEREARDACHGPYDVVSRSSHVCNDCGLTLGEQSSSSPVWVGVLTVRCR
jgi:hypothetical protein